MHRFTADGRTAVLLDAFGLTRVTFPNKVRTVREIMASELGALDLNAAGTRVLTYRDTWCQTHLHSLSDLAPAMRSERFNHRCVGLLPDGEALVKYEREALQVVALDGTQLATLTLPWSQGLPTPIGDSRPPGRSWETLLRVGGDGTCAVYRHAPEHSQIDLVWVSPGGAMTHLGGFPLALRGSGVVALWPDDREVTVLLHELAAGMASGVRFAARGEVDRFRFEARAMPCPRGDRWVTQRAPDRVVECTRDGVVTAEWPVPTADACGYGELMAHPTRVLLVPEDRERLVDVTAGTVIPRKLPVAEAKVRHFFTSLFGRYARAATRFSQRSLLAEVHYWDHKTQASGSMTYRAGSDGSLGAVALPAMLFRQMADGTHACAPFRVGGASGTGDPGRPPARVEMPDLLAFFEACDAEGLSLLYATEIFANVFRDESVADREVIELAFRAMLAHFVDPSGPKIVPMLDGWRGEALTLDGVAQAVARIDLKHPLIEYRARGALSTVLPARLGLLAAMTALG